MQRIHAVLAQVLPRRKRALAALGLALDFRTFKRLRASGLSVHEAAETMVRALRCQ
jgi:hypothetical protein